MKKISKLIIVSGNENKIVHIKKFLKPFSLEIKSMVELNLIAPEENGLTYEENALIKAESIFSQCKTPVLADDSGFEIKSLHGFPGTVSARFASACESYENAFRILNSCISSDFRASFTTVIALIYEDGGQIVKKLFKGEINGNFVYPGRGTHGFGYCPCFEPEGYNQTLSEMPDDIRMKFNHRAIALGKLCDFLKTIL